jgi:hypothetical protein
MAIRLSNPIQKIFRKNSLWRKRVLAKSFNWQLYFNHGHLIGCETERTMKNDINTIDTLGTLLAQIADLEAQAAAIKDDLKDAATAPGGSKTFEGSLFKATVIESNRSTIDWKRLAADLNITDEQLAAYTKTAAVFSVKVTSR